MDNPQSLKQVGIELAQAFLDAGLIKSKTEFRNHVKNGAIKVQDMKVSDPFARIACDGKKVYLIENILLKKVLTN